MGKKKERFVNFIKQLNVYSWRILTVTIFGFTLFIIGRSVWDIIRINNDIRRLNTEKQHYLQSIAEDSAAMARLRYDEYLEKYARENLNMQREGENIYIFNE